MTTVNSPYFLIGDRPRFSGKITWPKVGEQSMRKQTKNKRRSCGLCKPHKRALENRWKPRVRAMLIEAEKEVVTETVARSTRI